MHPSDTKPSPEKEGTPVLKLSHLLLTTTLSLHSFHLPGNRFEDAKWFAPAQIPLCIDLQMLSHAYPTVLSMEPTNWLFAFCLLSKPPDNTFWLPPVTPSSSVENHVWLLPQSSSLCPPALPSIPAATTLVLRWLFHRDCCFKKLLAKVLPPNSQPLISFLCLLLSGLSWPNWPCWFSFQIFPPLQPKGRPRFSLSQLVCTA